VDEEGEISWTVYDGGPRSISCPLLFLPPVSGRADSFFQQMLALSGLGYRVIAVCFLSHHQFSVCISVSLYIILLLLLLKLDSHHKGSYDLFFGSHLEMKQFVNFNFIWIFSML